MTVRRGFVLVAALWSMVAAGALALATSSVARTGVSTARNRANHTRAWWLALGCTNVALSLVHEVLWPSAETPIQRTKDAWDALDQHMAAHATPGQCTTSVAAAGMTANVNELTQEQLSRLLRYAGVFPNDSRLLADAVREWRDRNGDLRADAELLSVPGLADAPRVTALLGVERERILWTRAPVAVLATLPGMTDEALGALEARGRENLAGLSFIATLPEVSPATRDSVARAAALLSAATVSHPEAWTVTASASIGEPPIRVTIATRFVLGARRLYLTRQTVSP